MMMMMMLMVVVEFLMRVSVCVCVCVCGGAGLYTVEGADERLRGHGKSGASAAGLGGRHGVVEWAPGAGPRELHERGNERMNGEARK